jgi:hypothetical protein
MVASAYDVVYCMLGCLTVFVAVDQRVDFLSSIVIRDRVMCGGGWLCVTRGDKQTRVLEIDDCYIHIGE